MQCQRHLSLLPLAKGGTLHLFLAAIANEAKFDEINLELFGENDISLYVYREQGGSYLGYTCSPEQRLSTRPIEVYAL